MDDVSRLVVVVAVVVPRNTGSGNSAQKKEVLNLGWGNLIQKPRVQTNSEKCSGDIFDPFLKRAVLFTSVRFEKNVLN